MKKILLFLMSLLILVMAGCTAKVSREPIDIGTVSLTLKDNIISADGIDSCYLDIKVYDIDGELVKVNNDDIVLEIIGSGGSECDVDDNWNFTAEKAGIYTVRINVDGIYSNTVTVTAVESNTIKSVVITASVNAVYADGIDSCYLDVKAYDIDGYLVNLNNYNVQAEVVSSGGEWDIDDNWNFTAQKAGTYTIKIKVDGISSNTVIVTAVESNTIKSVVITASANAVYADGTDYSQISVKAYNSNGKEVSLTGKTASFYTTAGSAINTTGKFIATVAGNYNISAKVDGISSNTITISVRRGLKIVNSATYSIHLITWEPTANDIYWFTPETEYSKFYAYDNGYVPTLKKSTSCQQEVIAGTSYLYFVLTGTSDFGYYRTTEKISVGTNGAADGRSFEFTNSTTGVETDENQSDLTPVPVLQEIEISSKGVRSVAREIPLIKITKEEMNK